VRARHLPRHFLFLPIVFLVFLVLLRLLLLLFLVVLRVARRVQTRARGGAAESCLVGSLPIYFYSL